MPEINAHQTPTRLIDLFPVRIADRFLGMSLGALRGIGLVLRYSLFELASTLGFVLLMQDVLTAIYENFKKKGWSTVSGLFITLLTFLPVILGIGVVMGFSLAIFATRISYLILHPILEGWLNRSHQEWNLIKTDFNKANASPGRWLYLYYRYWPEVFKARRLNSVPQNQKNEAYYKKLFPSLLYGNELNQIQPYVSPSTRLKYSVSLVMTQYMLQTFEIERTLRTLAWLQALIQTGDPRADGYLDVSLQEFEYSLRATWGIYVFFIQAQKDFFEDYQTNRRQSALRLIEDLTVINQEFANSLHLAFEAWSNFEAIQTRMDASSTIDSQSRQDRESAKAILQAQISQLNESLRQWQIPQTERRQQADDFPNKLMTEAEFVAFELTGDDLESIRHHPLTEEQKNSYAACDDPEVKHFFDLYKEESSRLERDCLFSWIELSPEEKVVLVKQYTKTQTLPSGEQQVQSFPVFKKSTPVNKQHLHQLCCVIGSVQPVAAILHPLDRDPIFSRDPNIKPAQIEVQEGGKTEKYDTRYRYHRYLPEDRNGIYSYELKYIAQRLEEAYQKVQKQAQSTCLMLNKMQIDPHLMQIDPHLQNRKTVNDAWLTKIAQGQRSTNKACAVVFSSPQIASTNPNPDEINPQKSSSSSFVLNS